MQKLIVSGRSTSISLDTAWELITDIKNYPKRIMFVKKVKIYGLGKGSQWDDLTTILWFPLKMRHTITSFKKNAEYSFYIPIQTGGFMKQKYILTQESKKCVKIEITVTFDLGNYILNSIFGTILKQRLKKMLISSIQNVGAELC